MLLLLTSAALAASPGGFRVGPGPAADMIGVRQAVVPSAGGTTTWMAVPRAHVSVGDFAVDVEVPVIGAFGGYTAGGIGQARVGGYRTFEGSRGATHATGLEVAFPGAPPSLRLHAWAGLARETLPGFELSVVYETTTRGDATRTFRALVGRRSGRLDAVEPTFFFGDAHPAFEVALVQLLPLSDLWSIVGEVELVWDHVPFSMRALGRVDLDAVSVDLGVQASVGGPFDFGAVVGQVRWRLP